MLKRLILCIALLGGAPSAAMADTGQDFIVERLGQQYRSSLRQAGGDAAKKAKLTVIYKRALKTIQSKPGLGGSQDAFKAIEEMQAILK